MYKLIKVKNNEEFDIIKESENLKNIDDYTLGYNDASMINKCEKKSDLSLTNFYEEYNRLCNLYNVHENENRTTMEVLYILLSKGTLNEKLILSLIKFYSKSVCGDFTIINDENNNVILPLFKNNSLSYITKNINKFDYLKKFMGQDIDKIRKNENIIYQKDMNDYINYLEYLIDNYEVDEDAIISYKEVIHNNRISKMNNYTDLELKESYEKNRLIMSNFQNKLENKQTCLILK